jgi:hypothetical protein
MLDTPTDILVRRSVGLHLDVEAPYIPFWVTGMYPGEPENPGSEFGWLPSVVIPVVTTFDDDNEYEASPRMVVVTARILAARLYGYTREGITWRGITARKAKESTYPFGWFESRCPATGVTFLVWQQGGDLSQAMTRVENVYRLDHEYGFLSAISTSKTTRPARLWPLASDI